MPVFEVGPSGELEAYQRRILSRIGLGVIGSLIGCGLLGWGALPIAIQGRTFGDVLNAYTLYPAIPRAVPDILILFAVPMLFGFSERALTSFEQQVFR